MAEELRDRPAGRGGADPAQDAGHGAAAGPEPILVGFRGGRGIEDVLGIVAELVADIVIDVELVEQFEQLLRGPAERRGRQAAAR